MHTIPSAISDIIDSTLDDGRLFSNVTIPDTLRDAYLVTERQKRRQVLSVGLSLGMVLFPGFIAFDAVLMPDVLLVSAMMRFGIALPLAAALLSAIRRDALPLKAIELSVCGLMWLVAAMVCYLVARSVGGTGVIVSAMGVNVIMMFLTVIFQPPIRHTSITLGLILLVLAASMAVAPRISLQIWVGIMALAFATAIPALYAGWYIGNERKRQFMSAARDRLRMGELSRQNALLHKLSASDPLTALPNRRAFDDTLQEVAEEARAAGRFVAVAMIDIDFFKLYNDHYGHPAGDACLRRVADAIAAAAGAPDRAARFGGEEFAVIVSDDDPSMLPLAGERIRRSVEQLGLPHAGIGPTACVSISVGIEYTAKLPDDTAFDWKALIRCADEALYEAKRKGRNRVHMLRPIEAAADAGCVPAVPMSDAA